LSAKDSRRFDTGPENPGLPVVKRADRSTVAAATAALERRGGRPSPRKILPFLGPAFIATVAYIDPGNFATNIQGGAQFGYLLLWVVVASNLMAMLVQALSAKLGIATGRNLAQVMRDRYPRAAVIGLWVLGEVVAMATDLAEFLGAALGFNLLFGMPLLVAGFVTGVCTFLILGLQRYGFRPLEAIITVLVGVVGLCYLIELVFAPTNWGQAGRALTHPAFQGSHSVVLAAGILGATVMPHVIFLHSALTQDRIVAPDAEKMRRLFRFELVDVIMALGIAGLINAAMLIMAASTFHGRGLTDVGTIEQAHQTLAPLLGSASGVVFAIALLASGLSSASVGTMSGQVIMQGFLHRTIPVWLRRGVTMVPALVVIALRLDPTRTLVLSQVVLSFAIPFALVPLVVFTRNKKLMGPLVNRRLTSLSAMVVALLIVSLNVFLLYQTFVGVLS
jgi:manganese transport protein